MNRKEFKTFFEGKHFKVTNGSNGLAYGVLEEYPVAVVYNSATRFALNVSVETGDLKEKMKALNKENKKLRFTKAKDGVNVYIQVGNQHPEDDYRAQTGEVLSILRRVGVRPASACAMCKQGGCDALIGGGAYYVPVHRRCVDQKENQAVVEAEKNEADGNYITGVIGALLGAFVGVIPSLITTLFMERIYSLLFALIPLCIYGGYKLFKGKMNKFVIVLSVVLSVLSVFLLEIEVIIFGVMNEYGVTFSESCAVLAIAGQEPGFWGAVLSDCIIPLVFVALGIFIAWGQIRKTNVNMVQDAKSLRDTMMPYGDAMLQQDFGNETLNQ